MFLWSFSGRVDRAPYCELFSAAGIHSNLQQQFASSCFNIQTECLSRPQPLLSWHSASSTHPPQSFVLVWFLLMLSRSYLGDWKVRMVLPDSAADIYETFGPAQLVASPKDSKISTQISLNVIKVQTVHTSACFRLFATSGRPSFSKSLQHVRTQL